MKKVLLLCTSHNDLGLIRGLRKLNLYIIATGNRKGSPGEHLVDKWIPLDYSDKEKILELSKDENIDYICACCNDFGVYTAAYVAEKLSLPGYDSYETTLILHNKDKFKRLAKELGLISPLSRDFDDYDESYNYLISCDLPVIVKPVDCSAGNGIDIVDDFGRAKEVLDYAFYKSRTKRIVIEPYIKGSQHGFCSFLVNKKVVAFSSNNEYSILNPYRVEIDTFPSSNWNDCKDILITQIEKIASYLDLKDGIFHLQYIFSNGKPYIIEVMRRTLGNMYHVLANELNNVDWEYYEARARCGMDCSSFPVNVSQNGYFAYKTVLANQNGMIKKISIPESLNSFIFKKFMILKEGEHISNYKSEPIGFLFLKFDSLEQMGEVLIQNYTNDLVEIY